MKDFNCPCCGYTGKNRISIDGSRIYIDGEEYKATPKQAAIFAAIAEGNGRAVSYSTIIDNVWADDPDGGPLTVMNTIKAHLSNLKGRHPIFASLIASDHGIGYRLKLS